MVHKILYLQSTSEISGTDFTLLRTVQMLDRTKYQAHVILNKEGPFSEDYRKAGCKVHVVSEMRQWRFKRGLLYILLCLLGYFPAVLRIAKKIKDEKIDVVHTNTIHNPYGFLAAKIAGKAHLWHIREIVVQSRFLKWMEVKLVHAFSHKFIVMDDAIAEAFKKKGRYPSHMEKLYDGVDLEVYVPRAGKSSLRAELGVAESAKLVGMVCRLDPWKGVELFLDAAKLVSEKMPETRFWICGGAIAGRESYARRLEQKVRDLALDDKTLLTGWRYSGKQIPRVYQGLDIAVQCSTQPEPYGLVNVEAMACGLAVVAMSEGGPLELCGEEGAALLVPPRDSHALSEAILKILGDSQLEVSMRKAARERAEALFDHQKCVHKLESIYDTLLGEK